MIGDREHGLGPNATVVDDGEEGFAPVAVLNGNNIYLQQGNDSIFMSAGQARAAFAALALDRPAASQGERYQHAKRGTTYEVVGTASLQIATNDLVDGSDLVIYRGDDGKLWAREEGEFHDGRFLSVSPANQEPAHWMYAQTSDASRGEG